MALVKPTSRIYRGTKPLSAFYKSARKVWEPVVSYLFTEDWNTADDTHWDWAKWPQQTPYCPIVSGQGSVPASGGPSEVFADAYVTDFEMTCKLTWTSSIAGMYPEIGWRIYDGIGGYNAASGYVIQIDGSATSVYIYRVGGYNVVGGVASSPGLGAAGTRWFKIRVVGNNHKVKWWTDGNAEPGTWQIDVTDASPPKDSWGVNNVVGGAIGFRNYGGNAYTVDDLTVTNLGFDYGPDGSIRTLSNGRININGSSNVYPTDTDLSWCCWFKTTDGSFTSTTSIMGLFAGGATYCITLISTAGILVQNLNDGSFSTGYAWPVDTWVFVAMSRSITGGTDLYYAPTGTPTLTKTHSANKGTVTGLTQWMMSDDFSSSPYAQGAAFKIWKAALTQADFTAEMASYSAVRTANLFASYPLRDGMYYAPENDPLNTNLWLWWAGGGLVSGPKVPGLT